MDKKRKFDELFGGARDAAVKARLAAAEQIVIGYYYDAMKVLAVRAATGDMTGSMPDDGPVRRAVTEINRACADQRKPYLFDGKIGVPGDLLAFAGAIAGIGKGGAAA